VYILQDEKIKNKITARNKSKGIIGRCNSA